MAGAKTKDKDADPQEIRVEDDNQEVEVEIELDDEDAADTDSEDDADDDSDEDGDEDEDADAADKSDDDEDGDEDEDDDKPEVEARPLTKTEKNRLERQKKKENARAKWRQKNEEVAQLRETITRMSQSVEAVRIQGTLAGLEDKRSKAVQLAGTLQHNIQVAAQKGDTAAFQKYQQDYTTTVNYINGIDAQKENLKTEAVNHAQAGVGTFDEKAITYARGFRERHPWFVPNGNDLPSQIIKQIEQHLVSKGFKQGTRVFWDSLDKEAAKRLPEYFGRREKTEKTEQRTTVEKPRPRAVISSGGASGANRTIKVAIPKHVMATLDQSGITDPAERQAVLKDWYAKQGQGKTGKSKK